MNRVILHVDHEIGYRLLINSISNSEKFDLELVAVVTTRLNSVSWWEGVAEVCKCNNLLLFIYEDIDLDEVKNLNADWFFLLSWKYLLSSEYVDLSKNGVVNLHYSMLPKHRGLYPVNWAIISGDKYTGVTFHKIDHKVDEGEIIIQQKLRISLDDTARSLQLKLDNIAEEIYPAMLERILWTEKFDSSELLDINSYNNRDKFEQVKRIDLNRVGTFREFLDLLRGLTFFHDSKMAYFVDSETKNKYKITVSIENEKNSNSSI